MKEPGSSGLPWRELLRSPPSRRIYVDLDDVIAETTRQIVHVLNERFARSVRFEELSDFDLGRCFGLDAEERAQAMDCVHEQAFLRGLPVREGALEVLRAWSRSGYHVSVITGRPPDTHGVSAEWLRSRAIPHDSFYCVDKYGRYEGHPDRTPVEPLRDLEFWIAIEDSAEMAQLLAERGARRVLLIDRPWNRHVQAASAEAPGSIVRVHDWAEIAELLARDPELSR